MTQPLGRLAMCVVDNIKVAAIDAPCLQGLDNPGAMFFAALLGVILGGSLSQLGKSVSNQLRPSVQTRR